MQTQQHFCTLKWHKVLCSPLSGVQKKLKWAYPQEPAHFPKKPHFNIPARMDLLQCNESPALLPCTLMYSRQCS